MLPLAIAAWRKTPLDLDAQSLGILIGPDLDTPNFIERKLSYSTASPGTGLPTQRGG